MIVYAKAKNLSISPQKMRLVLDLIRGVPISEAQRVLAVSSKKSARMVSKVLSSAIASVKHNEKKTSEDLVVVRAQADKAPTLKRWRPRARGRADKILKRRTHLTIGVDVTGSKLS